MLTPPEDDDILTIPAVPSAPDTYPLPAVADPTVTPPPAPAVLCVVDWVVLFVVVVCEEDVVLDSDVLDSRLVGSRLARRVNRGLNFFEVKCAPDTALYFASGSALKVEAVVGFELRLALLGTIQRCYQSLRHQRPQG